MAGARWRDAAGGKEVGVGSVKVAAEGEVVG